jgi:hypothetical protein
VNLFLRFLLLPSSCSISYQQALAFRYNRTLRPSSETLFTLPPRWQIVRLPRRPLKSSLCRIRADLQSYGVYVRFSEILKECHILRSSLKPRAIFIVLPLLRGRHRKVSRLFPESSALTTCEKVEPENKGHIVTCVTHVSFLLYLLLAFISFVPVMTTLPRTSSDLVQISRAEQRKQRLRELETEQAAEEAEALKMTEVNGIGSFTTLLL